MGAIVENNDEENIHYYVINKGQTQPHPVGDFIEVTSLEYDVCPAFSPNDLPAKFSQVKNLLLGMDPRHSVVGTVWFEDIQCKER